MKRVIVFGATGNLGAYIAMHLKSEGYDVIAVGGRKDDHGFFSDHGMKYYSVDIRKPDAFDVLPTEGIDAVCHFAGSLPSRYTFDPIELFESITVGTLNVLNWMVKAGCKKIVFPQTPSDMAKYHNNGSVIPDEAPRHFPLTGDHAIYTIAKNAAVDLMEHYRAEHGIAFFALRFFTIYQYHPNAWHYCNFKHRMMPFRMLMERASKSQPIEIWGNCKKAKEMVYIKDFVRLVRCCVDSDLPGGCYNCGNGWQVSLEDQIKGIIEVFSPKDNPSPIIYCPDKPVGFQSAKAKLRCNFINSIFYFVEICMVAFLRLRHCQRKSLPVGEIGRIGGLSFLPALKFNTFSASDGLGMRAVNMRYGHVKPTLVSFYQGGEHGLLFTKSAPFPKIAVNRVPAQHNFAEEVSHRKLVPLTTAHKIMENRIYDLNKTSLGHISSFCYAEVGHNFFFYCTVVKYSVFRHWFDKLKCGNSNIANFYRSTLYFNILSYL